MPLKSDSIDLYSEIAASQLVMPLTNLLRALAASSGWPIEVIQELHIAVSDDHVVSVDYPEELANVIEDLEYGVFGGIPNAVIRPFISRTPAYIQDILEKIAVSRMMKDMGIL